jgi:hypothetical protein
LRPSEPHLLLHVLLVQRKSLLEHARELANLALKRGAVRPRERRVEQLTRDALDPGGDLQTERLERLVLRILQLARVNRIDDTPRDRERAALARAVPAASPTGVDEPAIHLVLRHALCKHLRIAARLRLGSRERSDCRERNKCDAYREDDEWRRVARREGRDGLKNTVFRSRCLTGKVVDEVKEKICDMKCRTYDVYPAKKW